ncbi:AAA family ATPase [Nonomuraea typhae]|uniref:AAA family ATPase n=1 Tax=Nonomuraea typhae TaxID=2603600 RepID=UPI0012FB4892|nr:AAA family ATPase [Nonomuraea typhae]
MAIRSRKPTGRAPWPLILIEGPEKCGKSWAAAQLSASDKVGQTYWLDLDEGAGDEYGAIPGARYEVLEHDGTWASIMSQVSDVRDEAARAQTAGEPPVVLVIDSMTAEWELLKNWAANRAKNSTSNQKRLQADPHAEVQVTFNLWNDATARHRRLMTMLMTFSGIVVMTARGKEVAAMDAAGRPVEGSKEYKVEGHKTLAFDASLWLRLSREHAPMVIGARSVHAGIRPGIDKPQPMNDFTLEALIFEALRCGVGKSQARQITPTQAGTEAPDMDELSEVAREILSLAEDASTVDELTTCWKATGAALKAGQINQAEADFIARRIKALGAELGAGEAA